AHAALAEHLDDLQVRKGGRVLLLGKIEQALGADAAEFAERLVVGRGAAAGTAHRGSPPPLSEEKRDGGFANSHEKAVKSSRISESTSSARSTEGRISSRMQFRSRARRRKRRFLRSVTLRSGRAWPLSSARSSAATSPRSRVMARARISFAQRPRKAWSGVGSVEGSSSSACTKLKSPPRFCARERS